MSQPLETKNDTTPSKVVGETFSHLIPNDHNDPHNVGKLLVGSLIAGTALIGINKYKHEISNALTCNDKPGAPIKKNIKKKRQIKKVNSCNTNNTKTNC